MNQKQVSIVGHSLNNQSEKLDNENTNEVTDTRQRIPFAVILEARDEGIFVKKPNLEGVN